MTVDLTVVIPTRDKRELLARTLAALARQDLPAARWDVVVVDDASGDDTAAWLDAQRAAWGDRLTVVHAAKNVGRARARNLGAERGRGRWLLFLDDDIEAPPGLLSAHLARLDGTRHTGTIGLVRTAGAIVDAPHFHYIDTRGAAKIRRDPVPARYLVTQNCAVPRDDFAAVDGFDPGFTGYGFEDMDLGFRLEENCGTRFLLVDRPVPLHWHHHTLDQYLAKKRLCGHGALQRIAERHPCRLREMRLHWVIDPPGRRAPLAVRWLRRLAAGGGDRFLAVLLASWPRCGAAARPMLFPLYARLMDAAILAAMCHGVADFRGRSLTGN